MMVRAGTGWQTTLADLSLILFLITAAAVAPPGAEKAAGSKAAAPRPAAQAVRHDPSPQAEPLAIYRATPSAPPLGQWLAGQPYDSRQLLTILAPYAPGGQVAALAQAQDLAQQADDQGRNARIIVEPGTGPVTVTLAYDQPTISASVQASAPALARSLQGMPAQSLP